LINVLVNRKGIAKTSSKPGRTQAINFFCVEDRFNMVDLPGYGYARVPLPVKKSWGKMVETYLRKRATLKAVVVILDIRRDPNAGDRELLNWLMHYGIDIMIVLTKADKLSRHQAVSRAKLIEDQLAEFATDRPVMYSSKTREGREEIWKKIDRITDHKP
jgi:GTP-binding protein